MPCGPINNIEQALAHPQVAARNMLVEVPDGSGGTLKLAGNPLKMSAFADPTTRAPAPDLDGDRDAILSLPRRLTPVRASSPPQSRGRRPRQSCWPASCWPLAWCS